MIKLYEFELDKMPLICDAQELVSNMLLLDRFKISQYKFSNSLRTLSPQSHYLPKFGM